MQKIAIQSIVAVYLSWICFSFAAEPEEVPNADVTVAPLFVEVSYSNEKKRFKDVKHMTSLGILCKGLENRTSGYLWLRGEDTENPHELTLQDDRGRKLGDFFFLAIEPSRKEKETSYIAFFDQLPFKDSKSLHLVGKLVAENSSKEKTTEAKKLLMREGTSVDLGRFNVRVDKINEYEKKATFRNGPSTFFHIDFVVTLAHWGYSVIEINLKDDQGEEIKNEFASGTGDPNKMTWTLTRSFYLLPDEANVSISYSEEQKIDVPIDLKFNLLQPIKQ